MTPDDETPEVVRDEQKPRRRKAGRPPKLGAEQVEALRALALAEPVLPIEDLTARAAKQLNVALCSRTVRIYLKNAGLVRARNARPRAGTVRHQAAADEAEGKRRYGYRKEHRRLAGGTGYATATTDAEWALIADLFENKGPGKPPKYSRRLMFDAIQYTVRTGTAWRLLPKDLPPWQDVYAHFRRWSAKGLFEKMHDRLRVMWREREGRAAEPTEAVVDSKSVRTSEQGGPKGYDAAKKTKGRKRHLVTDTLGLLLVLTVHTADIQDRDGAPDLVERATLKHPTIRTVFADTAYQGPRMEAVAEKRGITLTIIRSPHNRNLGRWEDPQAPLFEPKFKYGKVPKRWVVERTHAWNERPRRLSRDYERRPDVAEALIWFAEATRLVRRLATVGTGIDL
jgi:putative transposase